MSKEIVNDVEPSQIFIRMVNEKHNLFLIKMLGTVCGDFMNKLIAQFSLFSNGFHKNDAGKI